MKFFLTVFFTLFLVAFSYAQLSLTAFPFAIQNSNIKSLSLGNATVSLQGKDGDFHINPAGVGVSNVVQVRGMYERFGGGEHSIGSLVVSYKKGRSAFGLVTRKLVQGEQILLEDRLRRIGRISGEEYYVTGVYNYEVYPGLRLGAGLNYMSTTGLVSQATYSRLEDEMALSFDFGAVYKTSFRINEKHILKPGFGVSLTDFGAAIRYQTRRSSDPLPTTLRIGSGLAYSNDMKWRGFSLFEAGLLFNISKLLVRKEMKITATDTSFVALPAFRQLIESWGAFEFFDGQQNVSIGLGDQLWYHVGIEVIFLETLSLRGGYENAAEFEEDLSYYSFGVGLELFYFSFDYAYLNVIDEGYYSRRYFRHGAHWSITGRIPLDGYAPNSLLRFLVK